VGAEGADRLIAELPHPAAGADYQLPILLGLTDESTCH
jgi:hypothetical protein